MTTSLRVLAVDDEPLALERLQILLARLPDVVLAGTADSGEAAVAAAERLQPDVCLLDIGMPGIDGIETARRLAERSPATRVIFVTAFESFAVAAFDVAAVDYLVKPVALDRLQRALARVRTAERPRNAAANATDLRDFWVSGPRGLTRIAVEDVDRVTAERDYVRLHVGARSWLVNDSLARLEQALPAGSFVRLHRGALVRASVIASFSYDDTGWVATLADGSEQRVGRSYADNARRLTGRAARRG